MGATTDKQTFYDMLYSGYVGEQQLISSLYRNGLDGIRPPADMGIDVVSINIKDQLEKQADPETLFFQVKTTVKSKPKKTSGSRPAYLATFHVKDNELKLLIEGGKKRALVCYIYDERAKTLVDSTEAPALCLWIDGTMLKDLKKKNVFDESGTFTCRIYDKDKDIANSHWYATVLDCKGNQAQYLGAVNPGDNENIKAEADHYSIKGYLDYARS